MQAPDFNTPRKVTQNNGNSSGAALQNNTPMAALRKHSMRMPTPLSQKRERQLMSSPQDASSPSMSMLPLSPPPKRVLRVRNPFETAMPEHLQLPTIDSPSLFQRPTEPQLSSTKFEWTIDEVSSLQPCEMEPHETQFQESPDPELEARAQMAISSFFRENQKIVPSPADNPLRMQRIMLRDCSGDTPVGRSGVRISDRAIQTDLSLPPVLPAALEEALKPYLKPQQSEMCGLQRHMRADSDKSEFKDTSLRRKLFDLQNIVVLDEEQEATKPACKSKSASPSAAAVVVCGYLSDSTGRHSFGSLSSPCASDGSTRQSRLQRFLDTAEALSPISPPAHIKPYVKRPLLKRNISATAAEYRTEAQETSLTMAHAEEEFNPNRSSSPLPCLPDMENSPSDSINRQVVLLRVSSAPRPQISNSVLLDEEAEYNMLVESCHENDRSNSSSSSNSSYSNTPRSKRRSPNGKNLSLSFNAKMLEELESDGEQPQLQLNGTTYDELLRDNIKENAQNRSQQVQAAQAVEQCGAQALTSPEQRLLFQRVDSGFNEMTNSQGAQQEEQPSGDTDLTMSKQQQLLDEDEDMICCSTPTKAH